MGTNGGFAVLDIETTGFGFNTGDRIIEIGLVLLDENLSQIDTWSTLINPGRDAGPTGIHGIQQAWLIDAPSFQDLYHDFGEMLEGRTLVAHNASFDLGFLASELKTIGAWTNLRDISSLCTLRLSKQSLNQVSRHRLSTLAFELGLENQPNHSALGDAITTSQLLRYLHINHDAVVRNLTTNSGYASDFEKFKGGASSKHRPKPFKREVVFEELFRLLPPSESEEALPIEYINLLEDVVQSPGNDDKKLIELFQLAEQFGVTYEEAKQAHLDLFYQLVEAAWSDKRLTTGERADLESKAAALGISTNQVRTAIESQAPEGSLPIGLKSGDSVVLTGDMTPPKSVLTSLFLSFGIQVKTSVSRQTSLVIAADENSMSGKARKARELGIPIYSASDAFKAFKSVSGQE